jgi:hypothetical protein
VGGGFGSGEIFRSSVHQQRLMGRLAQRLDDKPLLALIGRMLKAKVVMPDGVKVSTEEEVPQGGPLSPLRSNIVLSELDEELARRGHRFVRYADDCNIYVRSERAGQRVIASVTSFINRRLRLKVNASKSAVARPETRHFLGRLSGFKYREVARRLRSMDFEFDRPGPGSCASCRLPTGASVHCFYVGFRKKRVS